MNINFSELKRLKNIKFPSLNGFLVKEIILFLTGMGISWWLFSASLVLYTTVSIIFTFISMLVILCKLNDKIEGLVPTFFFTAFIAIGLFIVYYGQQYILTHPNEIGITIFASIVGVTIATIVSVVIFMGFDDEMESFVKKVKNKIWRL